MHIAPLDGNLGTGRVEVFILQFAHFAPIHRIGPVTAEFLHIKQMGAQPDFLIRIEGDPYFSVFNLGMGLQIGHCLHDFRNAGLVIGSQQRVAVGHNQILAHMVVELGKTLHSGHHSGLLVQHDVAALIVADDARMHAGTACIRTGVHVADEAHHGQLAAGVGRKGGIHIGMLVHLHVLHPHVCELLHQQPGQVKLFLRAGAPLRPVA